MSDDTELATLAGGCFWCVEAAVEELDGVVRATSGYTGGHVEDPSYEAVCRGTTGHAEAVEIEYDPDELSYEDLLAVFFRIHDPTTADRQGPDVGSQYRPEIFVHDDDQRAVAERFIERLEEEGAYDDPIVTAVSDRGTFYEAEAYHQNYYDKNPDDTYCQFHAEPKIEKVRKEFADA